MIPSMEEPPINDDDFDALWDKAVRAAEEDARKRPQRRSSVIPKDPSERRIPRLNPFPISSSARSNSKQKAGTLPQRARRVTVTEGGDHRPNINPELHHLQGVARDSPPKGRSLRRHSSIQLDDHETPTHRASRRGSALPVFDEKLASSFKTQISFSNLPEASDLMKKPLIETVVTAASDFSSTIKSHTKKHEIDGDHTNSGDLQGMSEEKKRTVNDLQRKVAAYILDNQTNVTPSPPMALPTIHRIMSFKENEDQLSGLTIARSASCEVVVRNITPNSIFSETALRTGHEILTINNRRVKCPLRATTIVKSIKGEVNLLVSDGKRPPGTRYIKVKIETHTRKGSDVDSSPMKSSDSDMNDSGLTLESAQHGLVRVASVEENSVFSSTSIKEDDIVLAINGETSQSIDIVMESLAQFYRKGGVAILLVYSMSDLRVGILDKFIQSPWEILWDENLKGATISRKVDNNEDGLVSFCVVFDDDDWSCDLISPINASKSDKKELDLAIEKLNEVISFTVGKWNDAVQVSKQEQLMAAC